MDRMWLREALFAGMSANAFKLGTVLTCGWFWPRVGGCTVLYRGDNMDTVDFADILVAGDADASQLSVPSYVPHNVNTTYFYVVRRANGCGDQEYTLSGSVKVSIGADGDLAEAQPNKIFAIRAEQAAGDKVRLVWYYCPLQQREGPVCFRVYYDGGTGQIDYENAVAAVLYKGRKFYSYQSESLGPGRYLFSVRAEGSNGAAGASAQVSVEPGASGPAAVDIISAEGV